MILNILFILLILFLSIVGFVVTVVIAFETAFFILRLFGFYC